MSKNSKTGSAASKELNEFLNAKGFRLFRSETSYSPDGSGRVLEEVERLTSTGGLIVSLYDRGPFNGCVSIEWNNGTPWIDPCPILSSPQYIQQMLDCFSSMMEFAKAQAGKNPVPGDEIVGFERTLRRDGVLIIRHTEGAYAGTAEIKLPGGGSFIPACKWLSDKYNMVLALDVLDSMFEQQKKIRKK